MLGLPTVLETFEVMEMMSMVTFTIIFACVEGRTPALPTRYKPSH